MLPQLNAGTPLRGEVLHVTTDPDCQPGGGAVPSHALNLLEGIDPFSKRGDQRIAQVVEALLPSEGAEGTDAARFLVNWRSWLFALVQLALVDEAHSPRTGHRTDLGDVYELASDEDAVEACLRRVAAAEVMALADGERLPRLRLRDLFAQLAVLLRPAAIVPAVGDIPELVGRRSEHSYRWLTEQLVSTLRAFRPHGLLGDATSGDEDLPRCSLRRVAGLDDAGRPGGGQVTVVLAPREEEGGDARALLTLAVAQLERALDQRRPHAGNPALRPVLLLLDETRRIRSFKAAEYVSYARDAEAGCVVVYQSLEQAGDERAVKELLENVGTQIYMGSLTGGTAGRYVASLPKRHRPAFTVGSGGADGAATLQVGQEEIAYFSTTDLYVLPAGEYPALVQLAGPPRRRPILVSLDRDAAAMGRVS